MRVIFYWARPLLPSKKPLKVFFGNNDGNICRVLLNTLSAVPVHYGSAYHG